MKKKNIIHFLMLSLLLSLVFSCCGTEKSVLKDPILVPATDKDASPTQGQGMRLHNLSLNDGRWDDVYGGVYLEDEETTQVVAVVGLNEDYINYCKEHITCSMKIVDCHYSYKELDNCMKTILEKLSDIKTNKDMYSDEELQLAQRISGIAVDVEKNNVSLRIYQFSKKDQNLFKKVFAPKCSVSFEQGGDPSDPDLL